jgi:hypothetical protein
LQEVLADTFILQVVRIDCVGTISWLLPRVPDAAREAAGMLFSMTVSMGFFANQPWNNMSGSGNGRGLTGERVRFCGHQTQWYDQ